MAVHAPRFLPSPLRRFIESEAVAGLLLMGSAGVALVVANSSAGPLYAAALASHLGPLSVLHWVNDGAMALFFLLVGLEIKREMLHGQLRRWSDRALPGAAALGGMVVPALMFAAVNRGQPSVVGWAIPSATDIAFVLGIVALLGPRVPARLKVFLTALAVIDDLGAVVIIALFYAEGLSWPALGVGAALLAGLIVLNRTGVRSLWPYLLLGVPLWCAVYASGVHATVAGVLLALTIPADRGGAHASPLERLETALSGGVSLFVLPIFGFANAGVALGGFALADLLRPVPLGAALGLFVGKQVGVMGSVLLATSTGLAGRPAGVSWQHLYGAALLCGVGFTMSLFIGLLAFAHSPESREATMVGVFVGSLLSAGAGALVFRLAGPPRRSAARLQSDSA